MKALYRAVLLQVLTLPAIFFFLALLFLARNHEIIGTILVGNGIVFFFVGLVAEAKEYESSRDRE